MCNTKSVSLLEFTALVGALAWIPHLVKWIYYLIVWPSLKIFPDQFVTVGFTSAGPGFSVRLAFSAERKNAIINNLRVELSHSDGDVHHFRWWSVEETFSQVKDRAGTMQIVGNQQTPIAMKVWIDWIVDKFVHFMEPISGETAKPLQLKFMDQLNHWRRVKDSDLVSKSLKSKEFADLIKQRENCFWWKPGLYKLRFRLSSPKKVRFEELIYSFELTTRDMERLKDNIPRITEDWEDYIKSFTPGHRRNRPNQWNWVNAELNLAR